ncbi:MAG: peptide ABC transporter substrate-binding protein [Chloroflexi bacterium]|nr:peptide ABC transporter substrate-binding protein [Chloroflexota bacterium]
MLAVACSSSDETASTATTTAATATSAPTEAASGDDADQTLRVYSSEPQSLDPQRATDTVSLSVLGNMYAMLLRLDENQAVQPWLATEVPTIENGGISADGLVYTFKLRPGLMWSDGTPMVAQSFVDGAKRLFEPGSGNYYADFYRVLAANGANEAVEKALAEGKEGAELETLEQAVVDNLQVEAPDDTTVVYHLSRRSPVFLLLTTMWPLYPVRQDVIDAKGDAWTEAGNHISNGPFMLQEWKHNEDLTLVKNPNYFDAANVALTTIKFDMIEDSNVAFLAYQNGELDIVKLGPAELVQVRGDSALQEEFQNYAQLVTLGTYFNLSYEPFQDVRVRQALAGAINRDELTSVVLEGAALPAYSWVPPGMPGHDDSAGMQYKDATAAAQQLMTDAGYSDTKKLPLTILLSSSSTSVLIAAWLKEQWESNLPVEVTLDQRETATYFAERNAGNYQVTTGGWGADYPDPQNWLPLFKSGGGLNSGNFSDADYDALIAQADEELDNAKRLELYKQAQVRLLDQMPFAPMYYRSRQILVKPWVKGLLPSSMEHDVPGDPFFDRVRISGRK